MRLHAFLSSAAAAAALIFAAGPAQAQVAHAAATVCMDGTTSTATGRGTCAGHGGIKAKAVSTVHHRVTCKDGSMMEVAAACEHHGGVAVATVSKRTTTITKGRADDRDVHGAIALCKNGMYSHATTHRGACAGHGGVERWLDTRR